MHTCIPHTCTETVKLILKKLEDTIYKIKINFCCNFLLNSLDMRLNNSNDICDPKWRFKQLSQEFLTASLALNILTITN